MSEISASTHHAVSEMIESGEFPDIVWTKTTPYDDGRYVQLWDQANGIYFCHNPGIPKRPQNASGVMLNAELAYPITDGGPVAYRKWVITGPDSRTPHPAYLDGPTGAEALVAKIEFDEFDREISYETRFSSDPDNTYRSLARLAKIATTDANQ